MLTELRDIIREVHAASNLDEALAIIVRRIKSFVPVDACAVYLTDVQTNQYVLMASSGLDSGFVGQVRTDRESGLLGLVGERRELLVLDNATAHPRYRPSPETVKVRCDTFLGVPLIHYHNVLGVMAAWKQAPARFDKREVTFFVTIAARLAKLVHEGATVDEVTRLLQGEPRGNAFIQGVPASGGIAIGVAALVDPLASLESVPDRHVQDIAGEENAFREAIAAARRELRAGGERLGGIVPREVRDILEAYAMLLGSDRLVTDAIERIHAGSWAAGAWRDTIADHAKIFDQMEDPYLRARAEDIRSIGREVLSHLQSEVKGTRRYPARCILVGDTVGVTEIAAVPVERLAGVVCTHGSALSHTAVLARALGIPAVVSLLSSPVGHLEGSTVVVDGDQGRIYVRPSEATRGAFERRISEQKSRSRRLSALRDLPAETPDAARLPLYANIGLASDTDLALQNGAEGVGLYRTEYPFLLRESFPVEDEQYQIYRKLLEAFAPKPVTARTLDVGGDKVLPYFPVQEDNPFLGCRGIRFSLEHPEIFLIQLRALLRANAGLENLQVLFPMISKLGELDEALELLARAHRELLEEGQPTAKPRVGAMIEVPSAVFLTKSLAERVDYLSVGTNDLTQYILAADRNNAEVATPYDGLHPAVLDAVAKVIHDAHGRSRPVTVCGEMAGDPAGALVLLGMGIDALSMSPASLPRVKLAIRTFTVERASALVETALAEEDGLAVHRRLNAALEEAGI